MGRATVPTSVASARRAAAVVSTRGCGVRVSGYARRMAVLLAAVMLVSQVIDDGVAVEAGGPVEVPQAAEVEEPMAPPLTPREYLYATYPRLAKRLDCMIRGESSWVASADRNRPYVGLAQFDLPTWRETPQGRDGASRYDPYASIDAMAWGVEHLGYGRWPVTSRRC